MAATGKAEIRALMLRLPKDLHRLLVQAKKQGDRPSLNAEIVWRLRLSFDLEGELAEAKARLAEQEAAAALLEQAKDTHTAIKNMFDYAGLSRGAKK